MPAVQARLSLPVLCRAAGNTCAACCHGPDAEQAVLARSLERQTRLFESRPGGGRLTALRLIRYEASVRGLSGAIASLLLLLPVVGEALRWRWRRRIVCAYLGYEDEGRTRVGCLIHPDRHGGRDLRRWAFALWRGLGCGHGTWLCPAGHRYRLAGWQARREFARTATGRTWHDFGRLASRFGEPTRHPTEAQKAIVP